jgi:hypothetical protein
LTRFVPISSLSARFPKKGGPSFLSTPTSSCPTIGRNRCLQALNSYTFCVARGWESKSVEDQQAQALSAPGPVKPALTPAQIVTQRERQSLLLSRRHVLQQLEASRSPRHREILHRALADLDSQIARLV